MIPGNDRTAGPSGDRGKAISLATGGFSSASDWANGSAGSTSWPVIGTSRSGWEGVETRRAAPPNARRRR